MATSSTAERRAGSIGDVQAPGRLAARLRVVLQGGFSVVCDDGPLPIPHSSRRLVAVLALHERPLARHTVAAILWDEAPSDRAAAALRTALWRLRSSPARALVSARGHDLALREEAIVDFQATAHRARDIIAGGAHMANPDDVALLRDAGDLLPDWYDDWAIVERERFREMRVRALERLCRDLSAAGRYGDATQAGLAAVSADPLDESVHQALIAAHLAEGNQADALRQYELLRELLRRNLDEEPSFAVRQPSGALAR